MITEIEMLKKRIEFLENLIQSLLGRLEDYNYVEDLWKNLYEAKKNNEEEYRTNVARIGCRECLEDK